MMNPAFGGKLENPSARGQKILPRRVAFGDSFGTYTPLHFCPLASVDCGQSINYCPQVNDLIFALVTEPTKPAIGVMLLSR